MMLPAGRQDRIEGSREMIARRKGNGVYETVRKGDERAKKETHKEKL